MTCDRKVLIPEHSAGPYQLIRCCPELTPCEGQTSAQVGDCETVEAALARFYLDNQTHTLPLTASWDLQAVPVISGTTGAGGADVEVVLTTDAGDSYTYNVTADDNGVWAVDTAEDSAEPEAGADPADPAPMLPVDALKDGDSLSVVVTSTVGSCGEIEHDISGTVSASPSDC